MDVRTGSKSWGYSKRPRNWKKIMYQDLPATLDDKEEAPEDDKPEEASIEEIPEIGQGRESEASIEEIDESHESEARIPEIEEKPKIGQGRESEASITARIGGGHESGARIEKPKITVTLVDPDSSFSHI